MNATTASLVFDAEPWAEADMQLEVLRATEWSGFTDNFLIASGPIPKPGGFDDAHWVTVTANMRLLSRALSAADAKWHLVRP